MRALPPAASTVATLRLTKGQSCGSLFGPTCRFFSLLIVIHCQQTCLSNDGSSHHVVSRALPHTLDTLPHQPFASLNLHKARVRRNHGRLRSNGFIEGAPEQRAHAHHLLNARLR